MRQGPAPSAPTRPASWCVCGVPRQVSGCPSCCRTSGAGEGLSVEGPDCGPIAQMEKLRLRDLPRDRSCQVGALWEFTREGGGRGEEV